MTRTKHTEILSLVFFFILLTILPIILVYNKEEKIILSKAEESGSASPSATLEPTIASVSASVFNNLTAPITATLVATITLTPPVSPATVSSFPTLTVSSSEQPTLAITPINQVGSVATQPLPTVSSFVPSPVVGQPVTSSYPPPTPKVIQEPITEESGQQAGPITVNLDQIINLLAGWLGLVNDQPEIAVDNLALTSAPVQLDLKPTTDRQKYAAVTFAEKDRGSNIITQWWDRLAKKNRQRVIVYRIIMNPDGFVYTSDLVLTVQPSRNSFDEPIFRKQTLPKASLTSSYYFDRYGFLENGLAGETFYAGFPAQHNRLHTLTVLTAEGGNTDKDSPLTLDQWTALGLLDLRDQEGLSLVEGIRNHTAVIVKKYPDFNPNKTTLTLSDLSDIITWLNLQMTSYTSVTRTDLARLLMRDDRIRVMIDTIR